MPVFNYLAKTKDGSKVKGTSQAEDEMDLARILNSKGYTLISAQLKARRKRLKLSLHTVSLKDKMIVIRNLQVMIAAGVSLPKALSTISQQTRNAYFKKILLEIHDQVIKGKSFSSAVQSYPKVFPNIFASMIKVGEKTGGLADVLGILASHLEKDHSLRSKVKGALMYPAVVVVTMLGIGILMLVVVVPKLNEAFKSLNIKLPKTTRIVMSLGDYTKDYWYILLLLIAGLIAFFILLKRSPSLRAKWDVFILKIPFVSGLVKKINTAYTARTLSSLIAGGVSIVEALHITAGTVSNSRFRSTLNQASEEIKKGEKLSSIMARFSDIYPPVFIQMIEVGEETGKTSDVLLRLAEFFEEEVTNITQNLASIIEPILLILIGGIVAVFAISMIKPIYSMIGSM